MENIQTTIQNIDKLDFETLSSTSSRPIPKPKPRILCYNINNTIHLPDDEIQNYEGLALNNHNHGDNDIEIVIVPKPRKRNSNIHINTSGMNCGDDTIALNIPVPKPRIYTSLYKDKEEMIKELDQMIKNHKYEQMDSSSSSSSAPSSPGSPQSSSSDDEGSGADGSALSIKRMVVITNTKQEELNKNNSMKFVHIDAGGSGGDIETNFKYNNKKNKVCSIL